MRRAQAIKSGSKAAVRERECGITDDPFENQFTGTGIKGEQANVPAAYWSQRSRRHPRPSARSRIITCFAILGIIICGYSASQFILWTISGALGGTESPLPSSSDSWRTWIFQAKQVLVHEKTALLHRLGITQSFWSSFTQAYPSMASSDIAEASPKERKKHPLDHATSEAGNPFVEGWYADPDTAIFDGVFWVFATASLAYDEQTYMDAFSSPDLVHWTKHPNVLHIDDIPWARRALWAPTPIRRDGRYYLYFSANDIQEGEPEAGRVGGIGVAVAERPEGPYVDALGRPLIGAYHHGAQPIDQHVFVDDDDEGQAYIYYGGHQRACVAKLNRDMISLGRFSTSSPSSSSGADVDDNDDDENTTFRSITPSATYVEGPLMLKRRGVYYFLWSEGGWTGAGYRVAYGTSDSPLGPFARRATILAQDDAVARGSGHNGVFHVPPSKGSGNTDGTDDDDDDDDDIWYMVYHRRPLSQTDANRRVLAYDRMYFVDNDHDGDGPAAIAPVRMLVHDNFADGGMVAWTACEGNWSVVDQRLTSTTTKLGGGTAMLDTDFADLVFDARVAVREGSAGLVFRATRCSSGNSTSNSSVSGYYAGISPSGSVVLQVAAPGKRDGDGDGDGDVSRWETLGESPPDVEMSAQSAQPQPQREEYRYEYHVRVRAVGPEISVFVGPDLETPRLRVVLDHPDAGLASGANGVRATAAGARFGAVSVARP
ncbi:glycosyl hydrolase [Xylariaceae sp. FL0804]|nr:glycosyl hydrolase [Xylariaceae sp. FL0804]